MATELPDATAETFPAEDYDHYDEYTAKVAEWLTTHTHRCAAGFPVKVGAKFWNNDLRVCVVTEEPRPHNSRRYPGGEISTWHQTDAGSFDTMTGGLEGRLTRYYPSYQRGSKHDAENYAPGTYYGDVK